VAFDLKALFTVVAKDPAAVAAADVFEFLADQRGDRTVVLTPSRGCRRGRSLAGCRRCRSFIHTWSRCDTRVQVNPVPRGLSTRRQGGSRTSRIVPLVRVPRTLPKILHGHKILVVAPAACASLQMHHYQPSRSLPNRSYTVNLTDPAHNRGTPALRKSSLMNADSPTPARALFANWVLVDRRGFRGDPPESVLAGS
jgi:hypothetical protein